MTSAVKHLKASIAENQGKKEKLEHQVRQMENDVKRNMDFTYTVNEPVIEPELTKPGQYTTNCITCNMTCHENCPYANDRDKSKCRVMDRNGYCKVCPPKCHWSMHRNQPHIYTIKMHTVTTTADDLKEYERRKLKFKPLLIERWKRELEQVNREIEADKKNLVGQFTFLKLLS